MVNPNFPFPIICQQCWKATGEKIKLIYLTQNLYKCPRCRQIKNLPQDAIERYKEYKLKLQYKPIIIEQCPLCGIYAILDKTVNKKNICSDCFRKEKKE